MTLNIFPGSFSTPCKAVVLMAAAISWTLPATASSVSTQITDVVSTKTESCAAEAATEQCGQAHADAVTDGAQGEETIEAFPTAINSQITD